jgi:hypothetical protein
MKNFKIISLALLVTMFSACGLFQNAASKTEKKLIGKWDFTFVKSASAGEVTQEYEDLMKELLKDSYFRFDTNKKYEINLMNEIIAGEWTVAEDGKSISTDKAESKLEIIELTTTKLVLSSKTNEDIITMYLQKTK